MVHTKFQATAPSGPEEKKIEYFPMYFYGSNLGPPDTRPSLILDLQLNKFGKITLGNATDQISSKCAKWLRGRFFNIFLCISMVRK